MIQVYRNSKRVFFEADFLGDVSIKKLAQEFSIDPDKLILVRDEDKGDYYKIKGSDDILRGVYVEQ